MPYTNLINQIETNVQNLNGLNLDNSLGKAYTAWNNLSPQDLRNSFDELLEVMNNIVEQGGLEKLTHNILNSLNSSISTTYAQLNNFSVTGNQANYQNSLSQLESLRTNLRTWGLRNYVLYESKLEAIAGNYQTEYQRIIQYSADIEALKTSVESLIEPAVAGSLSEAFTTRKTEINTGKLIWMWLTILMGITSIIATVIVANSLSTILAPQISTELTPEQVNKLTSIKIPTTTLIALRVGVLLPIYSIFVYFFSQYNKERNFQEEYAHRAAVASSLPNYGNLAGEQSVKDQIISNATQVVFDSPIRSKKNVKNESKSLEDVNTLLERITKLLKPKE